MVPGLASIALPQARWCRIASSPEMPDGPAEADAEAPSITALLWATPLLIPAEAPWMLSSPTAFFPATPPARMAAAVTEARFPIVCSQAITLDLQGAEWIWPL